MNGIELSYIELKNLIASIPIVFFQLQNSAILILSFSCLLGKCFLNWRQILTSNGNFTLSISSVLLPISISKPSVAWRRQILCYVYFLRGWGEKEWIWANLNILLNYAAANSSSLNEWCPSRPMCQPLLVPRFLPVGPQTSARRSVTGRTLNRLQEQFF